MRQRSSHASTYNRNKSVFFACAKTREGLTDWMACLAHQYYRFRFGVVVIPKVELLTW